MNTTFALKLAFFAVLLSSASPQVSAIGNGSSSSDQLLLAISKLAEPQLVSRSGLVEFLGTLVTDPDFKLPAPHVDVFYASSVNGLEKVRIYRTERPAYIEVTMVLSKETCISEKAVSNLFARAYAIPEEKNYRHKDPASGWVSQSGGPDWGPSRTVHWVKPRQSLQFSYTVYASRPESCIYEPHFTFFSLKD